MSGFNPDIDLYLQDGCGRCSYYKTPECKVHSWTEELLALRSIVLETGLVEELKWKQPCYTYEGGNVVMVTAFRDYASLSFFKGSLLKDPQRILVAPGENSQAARQIRFTDKQAIVDMKAVLNAYLQEAIANEKAGLKVEFKKQSDQPIPDELLLEFNEDPAFEAAFESLTPGRQRSWLLHFSSAKQSTTRSSRIKKAMAKIFEGKGWNER